MLSDELFAQALSAPAEKFSRMNSSSILVVTDAGSAGRVLLGRKDLQTYWALTVAEALAIVELRAPGVCLVREELAADLLKAFKSVDRAPPVIVLLEEDGWERRDLYFGLGSTAMASELAVERILEAISELTGIAFRTNPRVPMVSFIDATIDGSQVLLETVDLSASGVSVRGYPSPHIGATAEVLFGVCDPPVHATAMVVRMFESGGETIAGMCFVGLDDERRRAIGQFVEEEAKREPQLPEPVGFTADLGGAFTLDLGETIGAGVETNRIYLNMLRETVAQASVLMPTWLRRVQLSLTEIERRSIASPDGLPTWASRTVALRVHLKRERLETGTGTMEAEIPRVIEHCCALAVDAEGAPGEVLAQVCEIRAQLLREAYEPRRLAEAPARASVQVPIARVAVGPQAAR
jgi:hypothetical protein